jgi:hypothetical protein
MTTKTALQHQQDTKPDLFDITPKLVTKCPTPTTAKTTPTSLRLAVGETAGFPVDAAEDVDFTSTSTPEWPSHNT